MHPLQPRYFLSLKLMSLSALMFSLMLTGCAKKTEIEDDVRPVRAMLMASGQRQVIAEYSGNVQPRVEARLGFRVAGKISARMVDVGSLVKPGQVLMQLDPEDLHLAQVQADGNLRTAQSNLELANNELKRYQELRKTNAVSQSMFDAKVTAAAAAQGSVEQARALLKGQANQAAYAKLIATSEGVVTAISAEVGQVVSVGVPVVHVAQLGEMEVVVAIPENNVDVIAHANSVQIHLWTNPQDAIPGKIRELSPIADPATRTFMAKISIIAPSPKVAASIKMGMSASVQLALDTPNTFIKVPLTALLQEKGLTSVWVIEKGAVKLVPIQIGGVSGNDLLIASGVSAGQTVVTAGVHLLKPGQHVSILSDSTTTEVSRDTYLSSSTALASAPSLDNKAALVANPVKTGALK